MTKTLEERIEHLERTVPKLWDYVYTLENKLFKGGTKKVVPCSD